MKRIFGVLLCLILLLSELPYSYAEYEKDDIIALGHYEQDNHRSNGAEPIEWIILDAQEDKALLVSRYILDCKKYNEKAAFICWKSCTLRSWLNETFLEEAFTEEELTYIVESTIPNGKEQSGGIPENMECEETKDRVFLLSGAEVEKYELVNNADLTGTPYAIAQGLKLENSVYGYYWWLRGMMSAVLEPNGIVAKSQIEFVSRPSNVGYPSAPVTLDFIGVRPAMWVDISAIEDSATNS